MAFQQFPQKGGIPSGNTAARPSGPVIGDTYYNGELGLLEIYDGTNWVPSSAPAGIPTISTITDVGTSRAYTSGAIVFTFTPGTNGGSPYGYSALASLSGANFSSTATSSTITLAVGGPGVYSYGGTAYNGFGTSPQTPSANVTVTTVPQAPTIGTATASGSVNEITVTWTNGATGGKNISAITITPYLNGTTAQTSVTAATTSSTSYTFTDLELSNSSAYTFIVKATNANGDSLNSSASNSATMPNFNVVEYLIVAGGGSGGWDWAGGGGAGGLLTSTTALAYSTNYNVTVGAGGAQAASSGVRGNNGGNSSFNSITADGGGGGGSDQGTDTGLNGGSGGGGAIDGTGGNPTSGQGYAGGTGNRGGGLWGAGGGGAGGVGGSPSSAAAPGGVGLASSITGTSTFYAGGGGGGANVSSGGAGGNGGGGNGWGTSGGGSGGSPNTGGGGGGGDGGNGSAGGSGVVILKYSSSRTITIGSGLTGSTSSASGGFKRTTLTAGSGNVSWV